MASVNFTLRKYSNKPAKIQADIVWNGNRVQKSIGHSVEVKDWSTDKSRIKSTGKMANPINTLLNKIEREALDYFIQCQGTKEKPSRKRIEEIIGGIQSTKESGLITDMIQSFIEETKIGNRTTEKGKAISETTYKGYEYWSSNFKAFLSYCQVYKLHEITEAFLTEWQKWQSKQIGTPANKTTGTPASHDYKPAFSDNYLTNNALIFNAFATFAERQGTSKLPRAKKWRHPIDMVVVFPEEVKALLEWHPEDADIRYTRDVFTFSIMTGLRISNLLTLHRRNVVDTVSGLSISYIVKKTAKPHTIKLTRIATIIISERLLEEGDLIFPNMSKTYYNNQLKEMGRLFGEHLKKIGLKTSNDWLGPVHKTTYYLGQPKTEIVPFYEMLSSHTGRRSCATCLAVKGYGVEMVSKVTGHAKGSTSIQTYFNISQQHVDKMLDEAWQ